MTRRERHARIIENFSLDSQSGRYELHRIMALWKLDALNDVAVEELARRLIDGHKRQQRYNREAKARRVA